MTKLADTTCPWCDHHHELVSAVVDRREALQKKIVTEPSHSNGDASFCVGCGQTSIFDDTAKGNLRFPTRKESRELSQIRALQEIHMAYSLIPSSRMRP